LTRRTLSVGLRRAMVLRLGVAVMEGSAGGRRTFGEEEEMVGSGRGVRRGWWPWMEGGVEASGGRQGVGRRC